jgi:hypothetical protein
MEISWWDGWIDVLECRLQLVPKSKAAFGRVTLLLPSVLSLLVASLTHKAGAGLSVTALPVARIADLQSLYTIGTDSLSKMSQIASSMALQRQLARSGPQFAKASFPRVQSRSLQDIAITRTGKPIIRISGGRYDCTPTIRLASR